MTDQKLFLIFAALLGGIATMLTVAAVEWGTR